MGVFEWALIGVMMLGLAPIVARGAWGRLAGVEFDVKMPRAPLVWFDPVRHLRRSIRARGGKRRLPKAALAEIVEAKKRLAEDLATSGLTAYADPQATLRRELEAEAAIIVRLLRGERLIHGSEESLSILRRHAVLPS